MLIRVSISFWFIIITTLKLSSVGETTTAVSFEMEEEKKHSTTLKAASALTPYEVGVRSAKQKVTSSAPELWLCSLSGWACLSVAQQVVGEWRGCLHQRKHLPFPSIPPVPTSPTHPASVIPSTLGVGASLHSPYRFFPQGSNSHPKYSVQDWEKEDLSQHGPLISGSRRVSRWKLPCPA